MQMLRARIIAALAMACSWLAPQLSAQGIATASIGGTVRSTDGASVDGARVRATNSATGFVAEAEIRSGRFLLQGLEIGGPYTITIRRIGFAPLRSDPVTLAIDDRLQVHFELRPATTRLDTVTVSVRSAVGWSLAGEGGTGRTISDSLLHRLPNLNRDFYDFVRLTPEASTKVVLPNGGMSVGGVGLRFNNYLIDGVPERFYTGNSSLAVAGGKSVPLDAVKEYQVLVAPFDVRYGDFAGGMVNAVTRSGTNDLHGSVFEYLRDDRLARRGEVGPTTPYDRQEFGLSLSGPILRDRAHFLIAPEFQELSSPSSGPYLGQPPSANPPVPVAATDLARFDSVMRGRGLVAGSPGSVETQSPLRNGFARVDVSIPAWNSQAVVSENYIHNASLGFSRAVPARDTFAFSSYALGQVFASQLTSLQIRSMLGVPAAAYNELRISERYDWAHAHSSVDQPIIQVIVPSVAVGQVALKAGTAEPAQGTEARTASFRVADNFTLPIGSAHLITVGAEADHVRLDRSGVSNSYGSWTFSSIDSLARALPSRFDVAEDFGSGSLPLHAAQYAASVGDQWQVTTRLLVTTGVRADVLSIDERARYNAIVDSVFHRRTDRMPAARVQLSPRIGFSWEVDPAGGEVLRGGVGVFTGRPPLNWFQTTLSSYGAGGTLRCGPLASDVGTAPAFVADVHRVPTACANGIGLGGITRGDVDLVDPHLGMAQALRASLAYERRLPGDAVLRAEGLVTRNLADFVFVNMNLKGPRATDRFGRVLYGSIDTTGLARPDRLTGFSEVIDIRNTARNFANEVAGSMEKRLSHGLGAMISYTYLQVRDVETPLRAGTRGTTIWSGARAVSGNENDLTPSISLNDLSHRVILAGTYSFPWPRWTTDLSLYYVGESGSPFTYISGGTAGRGDLNADGTSANDPIYVPRSAFDPAEITFSGVSSANGADNSPAARAARVNQEQLSFEQFIERTPCLRRQRGHILARNSCREPFSHTSVASIRQSLRPVAPHTIEAQLEIFNVLNLLDSQWGRYRVAVPTLLEQVGQTAGPAETAQPIFRYDSTAPEWQTLRTESAFQLQIGLRYRF
jgi:hypothetical protein